MQAEIRGLTMTYEDVGSGIPLLCLSAFPFGASMWHKQYDLADVARLIIPDYRGLGGSTLTEGPYTMDLLAEDMAALLDHLGVQRAVVMGNSMGNYVAFPLFARFPERVRGLVIADTRAEGDTPQTAERRRQTVEGLRSEGTATLRGRVDDLFAATTHRERPALVQEMQQAVAQTNPEALAQLTLGIAQRADRTDLLPRIDVPTVVICGEEDTVSPPEGMREMAARIPGAQFYLIREAGHLAPLEQPDAFNRIVREFLVRLA